MPFESAFRSSLWLACLLSFSALAATGEIFPLAVIIGYSAFLVAPTGRLRNRMKFSGPTWTGVTLVAFILCAFYAWAIDVINGIVYFFIYLQFHKLVVGRLNRDFLQLYAISLFQMVGAAAMTVSLAFGLFFFAYLAAATWSLILLTCRRDYALSHPQDADDVEPPDHMGAGWIVRFGQAFLVVLIITAVLFVYIPRYSAQNYFYRIGKGEPEKVPGFSETVSLGSFSSSNLNGAVVMRVKPTSSHRPEYLRMRGMHLTDFDGKQWKIAGAMGVTWGATSNFTGFSRQAFFDRPEKIQQSNIRLKVELFSADIQMEPGFLRVLPLPYDPQNMALPDSVRVGVNWDAGSLEFPGPPSTKIDYKTTWRNWGAADGDIIELANSVDVDRMWETNNGPPGSIIEEIAIDIKGGLRQYFQARMLMDGQQGSAQWEQLDQDQWEENWQFFYDQRPDVFEPVLLLPKSVEGNGRVAELALQVAGTEGRPFERARRIERYFVDNFRYVLDAPQDNTGAQIGSKDELERFLFETRAGHCEHFATGMAVLCRQLGIPARVVVGFYSDEWNSIGNFFIVRQEHAHSWVEIHDPSLGWVAFEPTPSSGLGGTRNPRDGWGDQLASAYDALRSYWYQHVVDYGFWQQRKLIGKASGGAGRFSNSLRNRMNIPNVPNALRLSEYNAGVVALIGLAILIGGIGITVTVWSLVTRRKSTWRNNKWERLRRDFGKILGHRDESLRSVTFRTLAHETDTKLGASGKESTPARQLAAMHDGAAYGNNGDSPTGEAQRLFAAIRQALKNRSD